MAGETLPALLRENALRFGDRKVAIREKEYGIWQSVTWKGYYENVKFLALGLLRLGFSRGDKLVIIGDNRPEWIYAELAAQSLGGAAVGVFPDSVPDQVHYIIDHSDATFVMLEDQEQTDKILQIKDRIPKVKRALVDDLKGMRQYDDPLLIPFTEVQRIGSEDDRENPSFFDETVDAVTTEDVAVINYTSGTTGLPKGVMLTHGNMVSVARIHDKIDRASERFEYVSYLPLPWIGEQCMAISWGLTRAFTINFPEKVETVQENIREVGPHIMLAHPRIWEKMCSDVQVKIQNSGWFKRLAYRVCMNLGYRIADRRLAREKLSVLWRILNSMTFLLVFRSLKNYFGLARLRHCYTGGAPLGPEIFKMFQAMGVNIKQIYGMTEQAGMSVVHRTNDIRLDTVGQPLPEMVFNISDTGELLSRGPTIFKGYYKDPEATAKALEGGWFHSGDAAMFDEDNHIIMIDRMKDVMTLSDGSKFSPQLIENKLKFSPYIIDAVVIGKGKPYLSAMINIDMGNVGKWAENHQIPYTTFTDLSQKDRVYDLVEEEVIKTNRTLPKVARVRRFVLLYKELDPDDEELTRTRKVRRDFVSERYRHLIGALYGDAEDLDVEADIQYQDGKAFRMKTKVKVRWIREE